MFSPLVSGNWKGPVLGSLRCLLNELSFFPFFLSPEGVSGSTPHFNQLISCLWVLRTSIWVVWDASEDLCINPHSVADSRPPSAQQGWCLPYHHLLLTSCCPVPSAQAQQGEQMCLNMWLNWPVLVTGAVGFSFLVKHSYFLKSHPTHHVPMNPSPLSTKSVMSSVSSPCPAHY